VQQQDRLAHRAAADPGPGRDLALDQPVTRTQLALRNGLAQQLNDPVAARLRGPGRSSQGGIHDHGIRPFVVARLTAKLRCEW